MTPQSRNKEIKRLITAFEYEASKFHNLTFSVEYLARGQESCSRPIQKKHHGILLWQFVGLIRDSSDSEKFADSIVTSDLKWGLPNAELTCIGIIEGDIHETFLAMAKRAGAIFTKDEAQKIKLKILQEIVEAEQSRNPAAKTVVTSNDNPLAIWLNYLLFYVSQNHPGREMASKIEPDPFSLSLLALEQFQSEGDAGKMEKSFSRLADINFKIALSFPGEQRSYVEDVARYLQAELGENSVFYDRDYQAHLAHPNADIILQNIYRRQSEIVAVFLCEQYAEKEWCGLEWRAIRDLIKTKQSDNIALIRFDDAQIDGVFSIDGYLDARKFSPKQIADYILQMLTPRSA